MHFARSNRVSQIPAILLKNKVRQSKMKTRFSYDGEIKGTYNVSWKSESVKEDFKKCKIHSYIKHYIKVSILMFDVYKSPVERGELLIKVSSVLFFNQNCKWKVKVIYSACLVR